MWAVWFISMAERLHIWPFRLLADDEGVSFTVCFGCRDPEKGNDARDKR
jgi:hypothetical protein